MYSHDKLKVRSEHLDYVTKTLAQEVTPLISVLDGIKNNDALTDRQKVAMRKVAIEKAQPSVLAKMKEIQEIAKEIGAQRSRWENTAFVLSQQRFAEPASSHAVIARHHAERLRELTLPLLALEFQDARETGNLALLGLVLSERLRRGDNVPGEGELDSKAFSLSDGDLPLQRTALAAIDSAESALKYSTLLFKTASGSPLTQIEKLERGRLTNDRTPTARVAHTASTVRDDLVPPLPSSIPVTDMPAAT
jgi:hypothetical protein